MCFVHDSHAAPAELLDNIVFADFAHRNAFSTRLRKCPVGISRRNTIAVEITMVVGLTNIIDIINVFYKKNGTLSRGE
jgi:hypothetical protein